MLIVSYACFIFTTTCTLLCEMVHCYLMTAKLLNSILKLSGTFVRIFSVIKHNLGQSDLDTCTNSELSRYIIRDTRNVIKLNHN